MQQKHPAWSLFQDKIVFQQIQDLKGQISSLLADIANHFPQEQLLEIYPRSKGSKISMGNELDHCPYQVLDIFRDFDKSTGHNIRILAWWGHGLYIFSHFGRQLSGDLLNKNLFQAYGEKGYGLTTASSPWDYPAIANQQAHRLAPSLHDQRAVWQKYGYLQWFKLISPPASPESWKSNLLEELDFLFQIHRI